jgi:hypothetical protein
MIWAQHMFAQRNYNTDFALAMDHPNLMIPQSQLTKNSHADDSPQENL